MLSVPQKKEQVHPDPESGRYSHLQASSCSGAVRSFKRSPYLIWTTMAVFITLLIVLSLLLWYLYDVDVEKSKSDVKNGYALELQASVSYKMEDLTFGITSLVSYIRLHSNCSSMESSFVKYADEIIKWEPGIVHMDILPSYVQRYAYPQELDFEEAEENPGYDFLYNQSDWAREVVASRTVQFDLPELMSIGVYGLYASYPVWLPAESPDADMGCNVEPYNCSGLCYNETSKEKFWGVARTFVQLDSFLHGEDKIIENLQSANYNVEIIVSRRGDNSQRETIVYRTKGSVENTGERPVERQFFTKNLHWEIYVIPADGWTPGWLPIGIALGLLGVLVLTGLITSMLVKSEQHQSLLHSMLPKKIVSKLHAGENSSTLSENFDEVTILFTDIVGFTTIASQLSPMQVVNLLDDLYHVYDQLSRKHGVYKVETIGDAYMAVCNCPTVESSSDLAAMKIVVFACDLIDAVKKFNPPYLSEPLQVRVGIHSGDVVAGVVGTEMPRYCLFGDTVNTASRMETNSEKMRIHVSGNCARLVEKYKNRPLATSPKGESSFRKMSNRHHLLYSSLRGGTAEEGESDWFREIASEISLESRGKISVKGKGEMETFWVERRVDESLGSLEISDSGQYVARTIDHVL